MNKFHNPTCKSLAHQDFYSVQKESNNVNIPTGKIFDKYIITEKGEIYNTKNNRYLFYRINKNKQLVATIYIDNQRITKNKNEWISFSNS